MKIEKNRTKSAAFLLPLLAFAVDACAATEELTGDQSALTRTPASTQVMPDASKFAINLTELFSIAKLFSSTYTRNPSAIFTECDNVCHVAILLDTLRKPGEKKKKFLIIAKDGKLSAQHPDYWTEDDGCRDYWMSEESIEGLTISEEEFYPLSLLENARLKQLNLLENARLKQLSLLENARKSMTK